MADLVGALAAEGIEPVVASFEHVPIRGSEETRALRRAAARATWAPTLTRPDALNRPSGWGVPEVPVARLPVITDAAVRGDADTLEAHAAPLLAFGLGLAERWPFEAIHAHTVLPDGLAAARLAAALGLPLLVTEHDSTIPRRLGDPATAELYRSVLGPGRRLVAVSGSSARDLAGILGVAPEAVGVIPNAVSLDLFGGTPSWSPAAMPSNQLLYVGARREHKGIDTLLGAFAAVRAERPTLRLRLIGRAPSEADDARWQALAAELGVADAVAFEPPASRSEVAAAMRQATVFVHPSPHETFGMVAAEALASGLPVAATRSGGVDEILGDIGTYGELATGSDAPALAAAIGRVLDRRATFDPAQMRAHVAEAFGPTVVASRTIRAYEVLRGEAAAADGYGNPARGPTTPGFGDASAAAFSEGAPRAFRAPLVVALNRTAAVRGAILLPPPLLARLTVVTSPASERSPEPLPAAGRWIELDPDRRFRELLAGLEPPGPDAGPAERAREGLLGRRRERARRELVARRAELRAETEAKVLRQAWASVESSGPGSARDREAGRPAGVLCLYADDLDPAGPLFAAGAPLVPGAWRWLADAWDAAGRP